jgi:hypothetical protein
LAQSLWLNELSAILEQGWRENDVDPIAKVPASADPLLAAFEIKL